MANGKNGDEISQINLSMICADAIAIAEARRIVARSLVVNDNKKSPSPA
ncbi:MAG: hypothetical protein KAJ86_00140 [Alphaproteobacteria bacterium]|nr:hypothetical protein [Alphaproteobacteria bacterium]